MHPYTRALLSAIPSVDIHNPIKREILKGEITSPVNPGLPFLPRAASTRQKRVISRRCRRKYHQDIFVNAAECMR